MRIPNYKRWTTGLFVLALWASVAKAQQQPADDNPNQSGPIQAYHSPLAGIADNGEPDENSPELAPDTHSLSGAELLTLGSPMTRTYWQPHFDFSTAADSAALVSNGKENNWTAWSMLNGGVDVHQASGNNDLELNYLAGGMIADAGPGGNDVVQQLNVADQITFRRWNLSLIEQLSYLPSSAFGLLYGLGGTTIGGAIPPPLNPGLVPSQTVLTTLGQSLSSSSNAEVDAKLTGRTSLTFVGGYALLRYFDNGLLDYGDVNLRGGYNYQWTPKDTLALLYAYSGFRYSNFNQSINTHTAHISYGRRITGRLAFQVAAGPQIVLFRQPIPSGGASTSGSLTTVYWSASTMLQYQFKRAEFEASYNHGVSGGSGVLAGAISDGIAGRMMHPIGRTVGGMILGGYSRNHGLAVGTSSPVTMAQTYDYWFAGASVSRPWGRSLNLNLSYQMQYQTSSAVFCLGTTCGTSFLRNVISVGLNWRERPQLF